MSSSSDREPGPLGAVLALLAAGLVLRTVLLLFGRPLPVRPAQAGGGAASRIAPLADPGTAAPAAASTPESEPAGSVASSNRKIRSRVTLLL